MFLFFFLYISKPLAHISLHSTPPPGAAGTSQRAVTTTTATQSISATPSAFAAVSYDFCPFNLRLGWNLCGLPTPNSLTEFLTVCRNPISAITKRRPHRSLRVTHSSPEVRNYAANDAPGDSRRLVNGLAKRSLASTNLRYPIELEARTEPGVG